MKTFLLSENKAVNVFCEDLRPHWRAWTTDGLLPLLFSSHLHILSDLITGHGRPVDQAVTADLTIVWQCQLGSQSVFSSSVWSDGLVWMCCCCDREVTTSLFCVGVQGGRGTCASALWPPACRSSSCFPVRRWPFTSCCCRPSSCGSSSSSALSCSASTASSSCSDCSPYRPSPGDWILTVWLGGGGVSVQLIILLHLEIFKFIFCFFMLSL